MLHIKRSYKGSLISRILFFYYFFKLSANLLKKTKINVYKSASIHTNQTFLSSNRLELSPWSFTHVLKKIETTVRWNCMSKALRFLQITAKHQDCPFFTVFLTIKNFIPKYSIKLLQISLKLHEHRGRYWRKKLERFWKNCSQCRDILLQVK